MQYPTYATFRTAVLTMIDGDDANTGSLNQTTLDMLIAQGEQVVYYGTFGPQGEAVPGLRCAELEEPLSATVTGNLAPIPDDCLEIVRVQVAGEYPMDYVAEEGLLRSLRQGGSGGSARQYAQQGTNLLFWPSLSNGTTVAGRYYKKQADIGLGVLNAAFNRYPDVWLYAALAESAPFIGEDSRLAMWKQQYKARVLQANRNDRLRAASGSRLTMRAR